MIPTFASLVDMLRSRAAATPHARAYTFLIDGEVEGPTVTYAELDERARAIACALRERHVAPGDRALLLYPPGLDFIAGFFGALYARVVAVPCYPPHPSQLARALPRLQSVTRDAEPAAVLCPQSITLLAPDLARHITPLGGIPWIATDEIPADAVRDWRPTTIATDTLAFLQYTSGSTASPRGVMVSHGNLLDNLAIAHDVCENTADSVSVSWLPVIHDMGLIEGVLEAAFGGYPAYLMPPAAFLQRPVRWLRAITRYRATNSGGPNFAYDLCVRKITEEQRATLDLSSWCVAYNGAEPVRAHTLEDFHRTFSPNGFRWRSFYPVYGLAESTLVVSSGWRADEPVVRVADVEALAQGQLVRTASPQHTRLVSSGPPARNAVSIVDPVTCQRCEDGRVGEIWIASPSVARGYWGRPEESRRVFEAELAGDDRRFLRTGDLGTLEAGQLYVVGRIKDVLIIRGRKLHPHDLELTAERLHTAVRPGCSAAFALDGPDGARVVVVSEVDPRRMALQRGSRATLGEPDGLTPEAHHAVNEITRAVRVGIAHEHDVQLHGVALLLPGRLPKTTSGKVRRHVCAREWIDGSLGHIVRWEQPERDSDDRLLATTA